MKTRHTADTLTPASLAELASINERPCLSLYQTIDATRKTSRIRSGFAIW